MIANCRSSVQADRELHLTLLKQFEQELHSLRNYAQCSLFAFHHNARDYYTLVDKRTQPPTRRYLGTLENQTVQFIHKRRFLEESLDRIKSNLELMDSFDAKYKSLDPEDIRVALPKAYKFADCACFNMAGAIDIEMWARKKYRRAEMFPEDLKHFDGRGEKTRSKSEVIIANALSAHGIPYRIEQPIYVCGKRKVPDFIVLSARLNKELYWEHFGMITRDNYRAMCIEKLDLYFRAGLLPGKNLIITVDDKDGNIDALEIELIIKTYLLK